MSAFDGDLILRSPGPGDLGWIVHRHGKVYAEELGWGIEFEAMIAEIVAGCWRSASRREGRGWIAELKGRIVGCVFVAGVDADAAQLRLFFVEPDARKRGIGTLLLNVAIEFARGHGFSKLTLWTNSVLEAASRAYHRAGFRLAGRKRERKAGLDFEGQVWELALGPAEETGPSAQKE